MKFLFTFSSSFCFCFVISSHSSTSSCYCPLDSLFKPYFLDSFLFSPSFSFPSTLAYFGSSSPVMFYSILATFFPYSLHSLTFSKTASPISGLGAFFLRGSPVHFPPLYYLEQQIPQEGSRHEVRNFKSLLNYPRCLSIL